MSLPIESVKPLPDTHCWKHTGIWGDRSCEQLGVQVHCYNCHVYAHAGRTLLDRESPADYLQDWSVRLALPLITNAGASDAVVVFLLENKWFGLSVDLFRENCVRQQARIIPHRSNPVFRGLVNLRGELVLDFSLHALLDIPEPLPDIEDHEGFSNLRTLICEYQGKRYAFGVDATLGIVKVPKCSQINPPITLSKSMESFTQALVQLDCGPVAWLSAERLFTALEHALT